MSRSLRHRALLTLGVICCAAGVLGCRPTVPAVGPPSASVDPRPPSATARSWYLRARVAEAHDDLEEAERALHWVVKLDGRRAVVHDHVARFYMRHRRWDDARRAWERSLERDPQRWEPHAALASLDRRAGDATSERAHLESAVELRADASTHERLIRLLLEPDELGKPSAPLPQVRQVFRRWQALNLTEPTDLLRRARMAQRLELPQAALVDFIAASERSPATARDVAEPIVDAALQTCRLRTARTWAQGADLDDPFVQREVARLALAVGDPALLERTVPHDLGPAPESGLRTTHPSLDLPLSDDPGPRTRRLHAALLWLRTGRPERTLDLLHDTRDPWARVLTALAQLELLRDDAAEHTLARLEPGTSAWTWGQVLLLGMGRLEPGALQAWLVDHPEHTGDVANAAALLHRLPGMRTELVQIKGLRLHDDAPPAPDEVIRVPADHAQRLDAAVTRAAVSRALDVGNRAEARRLARDWTRRRPHDVTAWLALAQADPASVEQVLHTAIELDPCNADVFLLGARRAPFRLDDAPPGEPWMNEDAWLRRAAEADPLSQEVQRALSQRGLGSQ